MSKYGLRSADITRNDRNTYIPFLSFLNSTVSLPFLFRPIQLDKLDRQSRWHKLNVYIYKYTKQSSRRCCCYWKRLVVCTAINPMAVMRILPRSVGC